MLKVLNGIRLIPFEQIHAGQVYQWYYAEDGAYKEFFRDFPQCPTLGDIIAAMAARRAFIIFMKHPADPSKDIPIGLFTATINAIHRNFEAAILIDKAFEKKKFGMTALKIGLYWLYNSMNLYKGITHVMSRNKRLCDALETFGFSREGGPQVVLKNQIWLDGEYHNAAPYSMFKSDFNKRYKEEFNPTAPRLEAAGKPIEQDESRLGAPIHLVEHGEANLASSGASLPGA